MTSNSAARNFFTSADDVTAAPDAPLASRTAVSFVLVWSSIVTAAPTTW